MEEPIRDVALMAEIVQDLMINADLEVDHNELTDWAIFHLCDMVRDLRGLYRDKPADEAVPRHETPAPNGQKAKPPGRSPLTQGG
jgi:hypothetical protein